MRVVTFQKNGDSRVGVLDGEEIIDLSSADSSAPPSMIAMLESGYAIPASVFDATARHRVRAADVKLLPPIPKPGKIICLGLNYAAHAAEGGVEIGDKPTLFLRTHSSLIGDGEPIVVPSVSQSLDFEGELMVVIGKAGRHIAARDALNHVYGYSLFNDGSIRDFQFHSTQWTAGKNFDKTGAFGPSIVTADALPSGARGLRITTTLNGRTVQDSNTDRMVTDVAATIAYVSTIMTLEPGDCIASGTPEGVGMARQPPLWLKAGDDIVVEVEGVGRLRNPVAEQRA